MSRRNCSRARRRWPASESSVPRPRQARRVAAPRGSDGDLALVNGKFVDGRGVVGSALTIKNGRIVNVGAARWRPGCADDRPGRAHGDSRPVRLARALHARGVNPATRRVASSGRSRSRTCRRRSRGGRQSVPPGEFITCIGGWNHTQFAEARRPTKAELDAAAPRHAVYISGTGGGTGAITNSLGRAVPRAKGVVVDEPDRCRACQQPRPLPRSRRRRRRKTNCAARPT